MWNHWWLSIPQIHHIRDCTQSRNRHKISYDIQKRYRSGVGFLLYLYKHSWPKLLNAVNELSKCVYKANMSHYKSLLLTIKYSINTEYFFCQIKPYININVTWELHGYSYEDYAGDNYTRKIVTGYIVLINRALIAWCSRIQ